VLILKKIGFPFRHYLGNVEKIIEGIEIIPWQILLKKMEL